MVRWLLRHPEEPPRRSGRGLNKIMVWIGGPLCNLQPSSGAPPVSMPVAHAGVRSHVPKTRVVGKEELFLMQHRLFPPRLTPDTRQKVILIPNHEFDGTAPCEHRHSFV